MVQLSTLHAIQSDVRKAGTGLTQRSNAAHAARLVAEHLDCLPDTVQRSVEQNGAEQHNESIRKHTSAIFKLALTVINWIERRRTLQAATEMRQRLTTVFMQSRYSEETELSGPTWVIAGTAKAPSTQPRLTVPPNVMQVTETASIVAQYFREWAEDIEIEDAWWRRSSGGSRSIQNKRGKKTDPATAKRREQTKQRRAIEDRIFSDWQSGKWNSIADYARWRNVHPLEGWPTLKPEGVIKAIAAVKGRLKRLGKWPPK